MFRTKQTIHDDKPHLAAVLVGLLVIGLVPCASGDAYLDALQEESDDGEVDPNTRELISASESSTTSAGENLPDGMSEADFEAHLQQNYLGSYSFYNRMDKKRKTAIYEAYLKNPGIEFIRNEIKQKYLNR